MVRQNFTQTTRKAAYERSGGFCEASGVRYGKEPGERCNKPIGKVFHADHYPRGAHDPHPDTRSLANCVACCPECNLYAAQHFDTPFEARLKKVLRKRGLGPKPPKRKAKIPTPAKRLTSRPFEKRNR